MGNFLEQIKAQIVYFWSAFQEEGNGLDTTMQ